MSINVGPVKTVLAQWGRRYSTPLTLQLDRNQIRVAGTISPTHCITRVVAEPIHAGYRTAHSSNNIVANMLTSIKRRIRMSTRRMPLRLGDGSS